MMVSRAGVCPAFGAVAAFVVVSAAAGAACVEAQPLPSKPPTESSAPALEPKAVEVLKAASDVLAKADTLGFTAVSTYERAARNGQPLYYSLVHHATIERPDNMRVITPGDGTPDEFYYDGKTMTAYVPSANLAAVADAPPTLDKLIDEAWDKAAVYFPFADVIASDPYGEMSKTVKSAFYVGRSIAVGGVTTDMVALAGDDVAAELWIGVDDHLPRLVRVTYANEPARARYQTEFTNWRLNEAVPSGTFVSEKAASAPRMPFAPPGEAQPPSSGKAPAKK